jgi:hypothetical protein
MSIKVLYLANSGSGKSTSYCKVESLGIKGLDPNTTAIINVAGKQLNMKKWRDHYDEKKKNYLVTKEPNQILKALEMFKANEKIKNVVIDDFQYAMSLNFIDKIKTKKGENGFDKYNDVLLEVKQLFMAAGNLRDDQICWILSHVEEYEDEMKIIHRRFKSVGQGTHKYITPEGLFENVIYGETISSGEGYSKVIRVKGTDTDTCKTAPDMFKPETIHIPNDLSIMEKKIREYYGGELEK